MSSDRSRISDRPRRLYTGIVAQQGRVLLDRDVNDLQDIILSRLATDVRDIVGPSGTPDDGFRISAPDTAPSPGFWSPPEPATASPPEAPGGGDDFLIGAGSMYLGGHRVGFPPKADRPRGHLQLPRPAGLAGAGPDRRQSHTGARLSRRRPAGSQRRRGPRPAGSRARRPGHHAAPALLAPGQARDGRRRGLRDGLAAGDRHLGRGRG